MSRITKRAKGAISIFLVIILVSNYALVGLLVDSGRQRMARASAEMALDTAAASVLSYYDQMLYDLYGLFATDSLSEEKIEELLSRYVESTLAATNINKSEARQLTDTIVGAVFGESEDDSAEGLRFDGFDYQFQEPSVHVNAANTLSLAYTDVVEAQIIDHMKYRAPKALAGEVGGFLNDLKAILQIGDRISSTIEKMESTKDAKSRLAERGADLIRDIDAYNKKVLVFSASGYEIMINELMRSYESLKGSFTSAYDPWETIDALDKQFVAISNKYNYVDSKDEFEESDEEKLRSDLQKAYDGFLVDWAAVGEIAGELYTEANTLRDRAQELNRDYNTYISGMQAKIDADPENENTKTLYGPEIELAESTCGEVLKNMNLVLIGRQYTAHLRDVFDTEHNGMNSFTDHFLEGAINYIMDVHLGHVQNPSYGLLRSYIEKDQSVFGQEARAGMQDLVTDFRELFAQASAYEEEKEVKLKTDKANAESQTKKQDEEKDDLRDLDEDALHVSFKNTDDLDKAWECELSDSMDTDNTIALLKAGKKLLEDIAGVLENARDSLYVNEYIIAYFPNYVQHYNATDSKLAKDDTNSILIASDSYFSSFNASQAEVEYILSGNPDTSVSVLSMSAKLTAVRMMFNTVAILTDTAKIQQANTLAAAISGPFAPLVAAALLIAWALAESASDTIDLLAGKEVPVFKQGADWTFSLEGGMKKILGKIAEYVEDEVKTAINDKIDQASAAITTMTNRAVYKAYQYADQAAESAISSAKETINDWVDGMEGSIGADDSQAMNEFRSRTNGVVESSFNGVSSKLSDGRDKVLVEINNGIKNTENQLKEKTGAFVDHYGDKFVEWASKNTSKYFELGNSVNTGSSSSAKWPKMDYVDYLRVFLMFYGNTYKVQRVQELVQANVRYGADKKKISSHKQFSMDQAYTSVNASMDCTIKFMFMSNAILPDSLKQNGRMKVSATTNLSY